MRLATRGSCEMYSAVFEDTAVLQPAVVVQLLACEDEALLLRSDALLLLNARLDGSDGVGVRYLQRDSPARQKLDENLHCKDDGARMMGRAVL